MGMNSKAWAETTANKAPKLSVLFLKIILRTRKSSNIKAKEFKTNIRYDTHLGFEVWVSVSGSFSTNSSILVSIAYLGRMHYIEGPKSYSYLALGGHSVDIPWKERCLLHIVKSDYFLSKPLKTKTSPSMTWHTVLKSLQKILIPRVFRISTKIFKLL